MPANPCKLLCTGPRCRAWALRGLGPPRPGVPMPMLNLGRKSPDE
jgi:hypothetical protein